MHPDIRLATLEEAGQVAACVCQAFLHYIVRIGKQPAPMLDDYQALIAQGLVTVAVQGNEIVGVLVLMVKDREFTIETLAVSPQWQGHGFGKMLIFHAEQQAKQQGFMAVLLTTNRLMHESRALYEHRGFVVKSEVEEAGYQRFLMCKFLKE
jgi:ribosomal protein S18 acetylase RimI-like enzyme